jgi:hypothetical protein
MNTKLFAAAAALAWATALISGAAPACAFAISSQTGGYATCGYQYTYSSGRFQCPGTPEYLTNYNQQIKFVTLSCNSGGCNSDSGPVYTDNLYSSGRKTVTQTAPLCGGYWVHDLGSCGC